MQSFFLWTTRTLIRCIDVQAGLNLLGTRQNLEGMFSQIVAYHDKIITLNTGTDKPLQTV